MTEAAAGRLSSARILAQAERQTGAHGLADAGLLSRLEQLVAWINARGPYTPAQLEDASRQLQAVLSLRLQLAADRARLPAITAEKIERPVFVIGFPRSGTTLLHSLLAEDPAALAPRWWHGRAPSPPPGEGPVCAGRLATAARELERMLDHLPGLLQLHPYWDKGAEALIEDEELFTLDLRNAYPTWFYRVPSLSVMVELDAAADARATYRFHREWLQHLQWNRGEPRWALKGIGHQFQLQALLETYPDAVCIWPHRDPGQIQASMFTIASVMYESISPGGIDWPQFARASVEGLRAGLERVMASGVMDDPRVIHLPFERITANPVGAVRAIYERAGLPYSAEFERRMQAWLESPDNRADRYGRYPYSYEPFGLDAAWVREQFAAYRRGYCQG
jgi:hypothetical protein